MSTTDTNARFTRPPYAVSGALLLIGICNLLLLNGQFFTNTVVFLAFVILSAMTWLPALVGSKDEDYRRIALYVLLIHAIVAVFFATGLTEDHRRQQEFNELRERSRQGDTSQIVEQKSQQGGCFTLPEAARSETSRPCSLRNPPTETERNTKPPAPPNLGSPTEARPRRRSPKRDH